MRMQIFGYKTYLKMQNVVDLLVTSDLENRFFFPEVKAALYFQFVIQ